MMRRSTATTLLCFACYFFQAEAVFGPYVRYVKVGTITHVSAIGSEPEKNIFHVQGQGLVQIYFNTVDGKPHGVNLGGGKIEIWEANFKILHNPNDVEYFERLNQIFGDPFAVVYFSTADVHFWSTMPSFVPPKITRQATSEESSEITAPPKPTLKPGFNITIDPCKSTSRSILTTSAKPLTSSIFDAPLPDDEAARLKNWKQAERQNSAGKIGEIKNPFYGSIFCCNCGPVPMITFLFQGTDYIYENVVVPRKSKPNPFTWIFTNKNTSSDEPVTIEAVEEEEMPPTDPPPPTTPPSDE